MKAKTKTLLRNIENGHIKSSLSKVLFAIKSQKINHWSTYGLRERLQISHQTLTSALSNLCDEGLIKESGQVTYGENTYSKWEFVEDEIERAKLQHERLHGKYILWLESAKKFQDFMVTTDLAKNIGNELKLYRF
jgi:phage pi2 protein 07